MKKIELVRALLEFTDRLEDDIIIKIVYRDSDDIAREIQTCTIDHIGNFMTGPTTINITASKITKKTPA